MFEKHFVKKKWVYNRVTFNDRYYIQRPVLRLTSKRDCKKLDDAHFALVQQSL